MEEFKEANREFQRELGGILRTLGRTFQEPLGPEESENLRLWVTEFKTQLDLTLSVMYSLQRQVSKGTLEQESVMDEVTQKVQNELFPFALAYWTVLYCEKLNSQ